VGKHKEVYERFLSCSIAKEVQLGFPKLNFNEEYVLNSLSVFWLNGQNKSVVEVMNSSIKLSSSTIFRCLKTLRQKGYLHFLSDNLDGRVKYVEATKLTDQYLSAQGKLILEALESSSIVRALKADSRVLS
jgi:hypothetical protein